MDFNDALEKRNLMTYFLDATYRVVKARLRFARAEEIDDVAQDARLATLRALERAVSKRVESGETFDDAVQAALTREHIAAIASRCAKDAARNYWRRRRSERVDETVSAVATAPARIETRELASNLSTAWRRQIYLALSDGYSTRQISEASGVAVERVRAEIRRIRASLGVAPRELSRKKRIA